VTLAKKDLPTGMDVLVASLPELRIWFQGLARRTVFWTAEQAHVVLSALNYGQAVTVGDLAAQGFASKQPTGPEQSAPAGPMSRAALHAWLAGVSVSTGSAIVDPPPRKPFTPVARQATSLPPAWAPIAARVKQHSAQNAAEVDSRYPMPAPASPPPFPVPRPRPDTHPTRQLFLALGLIGAIAVGLWLFVPAGSRPHPQHAGTSTVTVGRIASEEPPAPPSPARTPPPAVPAPLQPKTCYPLQPDC
jgi:hypothetical protein